MKSIKLKIFIALFAFTLMFSSCAVRLLDFTVLSAKTHALKLDKNKGVRVKGESYGFLGIGASTKDAMDNALKNAGPQYDLLIDGVVLYEDYFLVSGYVVEGTAISSTDLKAQLGTKGFEEWCKANTIFDATTANN